MDHAERITRGGTIMKFKVIDVIRWLLAGGRDVFGPPLRQR
jgi:hypothetical protein